MPEKFSVMQNSDDLSGSSDSLIGNVDSPSLEQLNYNAKQRETQIKSREKIDNKEHEKADVDLENDISTMKISNETELNYFLDSKFPNDSNARIFAEEYFENRNALGISVSAKELKRLITQESEKQADINVADQIKNYKEELANQSKSQTEILSLLISKFENEESVSVWVENWRNFQKLHNFAESKPPAERKAIQNIIAKADFSSSTAFETSLSEISQSKEISEETKLEISRKFDGSHIDSVDGMDYQLKKVKTHKKAIEKEIGLKSREKSALDSEIQTIEDKIDNLPLNDPKRLELEKQLEQRKMSLDEAEAEINRLENGKTQNVSFQLREGFNSVQNADGSRSIKIMNNNFSIKLPSNRWLFSDNKNVRAINLAFPYMALKNENLTGILFNPNLENNSVPSKSQRDLGHIILSSLGFNDTKILSEENIKQLKKDLSLLNPQNGKSGLENMTGIGIYDVGSQSVDKGKLKEVLSFIRGNRSLDDKMVFKKIINI